jgi:hypothetical protein
MKIMTNFFCIFVILFVINTLISSLSMTFSMTYLFQHVIVTIQVSGLSNLLSLQIQHKIVPKWHHIDCTCCPIITVRKLQVSCKIFIESTTTCMHGCAMLCRIGKVGK